MMLPSRQTDHAIELQPGTELPFMRTYNLSPKKLQVLEEFRNEALAKSRIKESTENWQALRVHQSCFHQKRTADFDSVSIIEVWMPSLLNIVTHSLSLVNYLTASTEQKFSAKLIQKTPTTAFASERVMNGKRHFEPHMDTTNFRCYRWALPTPLQLFRVILTTPCVDYRQLLYRLSWRYSYLFPDWGGTSWASRTHYGPITEIEIIREGD